MFPVMGPDWYFSSNNARKGWNKAFYKGRQKWAQRGWPRACLLRCERGGGERAGPHRWVWKLSGMRFMVTAIQTNFTEMG